MKRAALVAAAGVLVAAAAVALWLGTRSSGPGPMPAKVDLAAGEALYATNCASCHGAGLEGQPDWQSPGPDGRLPAPPHDETGHTWHHADPLLFSYTKLGGKALMAEQGMEFDSGMPPFGDALSDREIWDTLAYIKSTWPERVRKMQADRSQR